MLLSWLRCITQIVRLQVDDAARKSAQVVQQDAHRRTARENEKLKLTLQRHKGLLRDAKKKASNRGNALRSARDKIAVLSSEIEDLKADVDRLSARVRSDGEISGVFSR